MKRLLVLLAACAEPSASVIVSGNVRPATSVDVVFKSDTREEIVKSDASGGFRIAIPRGTYSVFVRDDSVMSIGRMDRVRLPGLPSAAIAGAADETLMPRLDLAHDITDLELAVVRAGIVTGSVFDIDARPIFGAVVSAHGEKAARPALGTDVAISRYDGTFELRIPDGEYQLAASHGSYSENVGVAHLEVKGGTRHVSLTLVKGCIMSGRVVDKAGKPVGEGAIERRFGASDLEFSPANRINSDGTFRVTTTDETEVVLRAWPWHRAPSPSKRFNCKDGAKFTTTFIVPDNTPSMTGTLVDKSGAPMPFTYVDVQPLDPGGIAQQERTDAAGHWAVYELPPGRYAVTVTTRAGVVSKVLESPSTDTQLTLSGTGRIEGTTTHLVSGSFELAMAACLDGSSIQLPRDHRLVPVRGGRFVVDNVPACDLQFSTDWRGKIATNRATIPANGVARLQLDIGEARKKTVIGVVRDRGGHRVSRARVTATYDKQSETAVTDEDGRFSIETFAGATITVDSRGTAEVGLANVAREHVEIRLR